MRHERFSHFISISFFTSPLSPLQHTLPRAHGLFPKRRRTTTTVPFPLRLPLPPPPRLHHYHHQPKRRRLEDPLSLLSPTTLTSNSNKPRAADTLPAIPVTPSLLSRFDPNGVVLCAVCKDEIGVDDEGKLLPCNHLYHSDCITPWLAHHDSCPLCRFRVTAAEEEEEGDGGGDASRTGEIRRQLRAAMIRLSELMEEEDDDFYGLRITLNHIASRHGLLHQDSNGSRVSESVTLGAGDEQLP